MQRFGHRNTVIILYVVTALFGFTAYIYLINKATGFLVLFIIALVVELFYRVFRDDIQAVSPVAVDSKYHSEACQKAVSEIQRKVRIRNRKNSKSNAVEILGIQMK